MSSAEFLSAFDEIVELPPGTLTGSEKLDDLEGWNSMAMLGFIALADENGSKISPRQIAASQTVAELMKMAGVEA
jgi:acyl carrier protein